MRKNHSFIQFLLIFVSLIFFNSQAIADDTTEYFTYEDDDKTIINGLTNYGMAATSLTIPASVTTVRAGSFLDHATGSELSLTDLYILGNPIFEDEANHHPFDGVSGTLNMIDMGSAMTLNNIYNLLLVKPGNVEEIVIQGYYDTATETSNGEVNWGGINNEQDPINQTLTNEVKVILPAAIVDHQVFGYAKVYGRFTSSAELFTFCGKATFKDADDGSNWLFYVPTELRKASKEVYIKRVKIIRHNEGVLIHNATNTSGYVDVLRVNEDDPAYQEIGSEYLQLMDDLYGQNMLVGVTAPTPLQPIDGQYTNFILNKGTFYPTSGGTLGANRAYLQIPTSDYNDMQTSQGGNISIVFEEETPNGIQELHVTHRTAQDAWFTIDGRKLSTSPTLPGIYMHGGKKVVIRL